MSKGRKPKRIAPKAKLNGRATESVTTPPSRRAAPSQRSAPSTNPPRPRAAMLITIGVLIFALVGIILSTSLSDSLIALVKGPPGGHGQAIDSIPCDVGEQLSYHVHAHVTILDNGQPVDIPAQVGIPGTCFYWLHTHDTSGVVHVEAPNPRSFTLGQFFDIWGQPLTTANVAGHRGTVTAYVNQAKFTGDPRTIPLSDHASIVLDVGTATPPPANYDFGDLP